MTPERIMDNGRNEQPPVEQPKNSPIVPPEPDWMPGVVPESPRERQRRSSRPPQYGRRAQPPRRGAPRGEARRPKPASERSPKAEASSTPAETTPPSDPRMSEIGETQTQVDPFASLRRNRTSPLESGVRGQTLSEEEPPTNESSPGIVTIPPTAEGEEEAPVPPVAAAGGGEGGETPPPPTPPGGGSNGEPPDDGNGENPEGESGDSSEEPEAAPFKGELSDEEFDVKKIAKEAGIEFPLTETEDWEFLQKILENVQTIGGSTDIDEIIAAAKELNLPADRVRSMLEKRGRGKDLLDALDARSEELPLREPEPQNATPEERETAKNMGDAAEMAEGMTDEVQEIVNQMESGKISKKKAQEELGRIRRMGKKINDRLFDDEIGIWRRGARLKFVGRSLASIAFASLIAYLSLLHVATNWATKRVGK